MKKKFLALVLTLAMVLSLVPVTALATDGTPTLDNATQPRTSVTADTEDGVHISKKVVPDGDNYNLVMEAYVEGTTTTTTSTTPLDIVLVLDVSGSMGDSMGNGDKTKRIDALKSAVNAFIDNVAQKNKDTDGNTVGHKISIVKFAGKKATRVGNDTYRENGYTYNYSQIVKELTAVDANGKKALTDAVNSLKPAGATRADYGMQLAQSVLPSSDGESNRDKVVVMFTDGSPNSSNEFEYGVASSAIANSATLKGNNVKVYTVGIFSDADSREITSKDWNTEWNISDSNRNNKYMQAVSSNYPTASLTYGLATHSWNPGQRAEGNYYLTATNSTELNNVFKTISNSITAAQVTADEDAVLRDTLTDQFVLNGNANDITVKKAEVKGKDGNAYTWKTPVGVTGITKDISSDGKTVTVKGFDYTSTGTTGNVITENNGKYSGYKLIVTIPIKVDDTYTGWLAGEHYYNTNDVESNKAGLTGYTKGTDTNASTLLKQSPQVPVTAYTVTYDWGTAPAGENIPTNSNTYLTGKTYPVDTTYAKDKKITDSDGGTWHFSGWTDSNNGVMGTKNVTITGSWTYTGPTPPDPTYTLTYDANGGKADSVPTDSKDYTAGQTVNLDYSKDATHNQEGVIFIGWSEKNDDGKIYNKGDTLPDLIQSVTMNDNKTVYAVWGLDKDGDNTPDVFQATVTYKIEHGHWYNAETGGSVSTDPVTAQFTLYKKVGNQWVAQNPTLGNTIPTGLGSDQGYTADGWYKDSQKTDISKTTPVTGDVTYTFKYTNASIPTTYTVVLHLENGAYTTVPDGYTTTSTSGVYQYTVTEPTTIIKPDTTTLSRSGYDFQGWSLSKTDSQTLIEENETFTALYVKQSGLTGNYDKIDLYAVWKEAEAPAPQWDTSKSKKATNLDSNYESKVTLSLPSAEEKLDSDIVFVLDKSTSVQLKNQALEMLNALKGQADKTGAKIKVGVVIFNKIANVTEWKDLETQYDDIKAAIEQDIQEGTNIHAGLLAAKKMLDEDTDVAANRKYMILVSDGVTYQFCHNSDYEKAWTRSFNGELHADKVNQRGTLTELNIQYDNAETGIPQNSISAWMTDIQNRMNNGKDCEETYDYEYTGNAPTDTSQLLPAKEYVSNVEKALYLTKNTYEELSTSYNCYAILARETRPWGTDFMKLLAGGSTLNFESVQNNILYLVAAGSKVEDYMGYTSDYNFNFINDASKLTITVGREDAQKKLDAVKIDDNHYGFEPVTVETDSSDSDKVTTYRYNLEYIPGNMTDTEHFVWRINVPVENFAPVALTYSVKLVNPKSASGTYGQYDADGSKNYSGLYTNNSATLYPKDSNENWGIPENFLKPTVSYTVSGGGGGGGSHKPTVTIPDDVPTGLNGKDHYAYVVGYPDGMVYPQKNITRAEVATIFFRLLTDETREANMTKSNSYNDMKDGAWYTCAVSTLSKMGIIKGYEDGSFKPDASISRAEFAAIAARFDPDGDKTPATFSDVSSHWAKDEISIAANHGWIKGYEDGSFKPDQKITRAETMTLVNRVLKRLPETKDDLHKDMKTWPDNQNESAWFYLAVQEATNSHYQNLKKDGTHEKWESMRETRDWAALEK